MDRTERLAEAFNLLQDLKERGYVVNGESGRLCVRDPTNYGLPGIELGEWTMAQLREFGPEIWKLVAGEVGDEA